MSFQEKNPKSSSEAASASLLYVTCPACSHEFEVAENVLAKLRQSSRAEFEAWKADFEAQQILDKADFDRRVQELDEREANQKKLIAQQVDEQVRERSKAEYADLLKKAKLDAQAEADKKVLAKQAELDDSEAKLKALQAEQAELLKQKRQFQLDRQAFELEKQKAVTEAIEAEEENLRATIRAQYDEEKKLLTVELDRARKHAEELNEKLKSKPSQELQGEALEQDLEGKLTAEFPTDDVTPVKKGQRGGDIIQVVNGRLAQPSGRILWEFKRAQNWGGDWVAKAKQDANTAKAEVVLIVSDVLPRGIDQFGFHEGIWVTLPGCATMVGSVLRYGLIQTAEARGASVGRESKMELLYAYMTGPDFRAMLEGIAHPFLELKSILDSEKRSTLARWKRMERNLDRVLQNVAGLQGDLRGIAGAEMPALPDFAEAALPETDDEDEV